MLRSQAVSRIQRRLGFRKDLSGAILEELQDAQQRLEGGIQLPSGTTFLPTFLLSELSTALTVLNEERVPIPLDFLQEWEDSALWLFNAQAENVEDQWIPLPKQDLEFLKEASPGAKAPAGYAFDGRYFRVMPAMADKTFTLKLQYYAKDAVLDATADTENKWLKYAPYLMIGEAGREIAVAARDDKSAQYFQGLSVKEAARLFNADQAREHMNRHYVMGGDD